MNNQLDEIPGLAERIYRGMSSVIAWAVYAFLFGPTIIVMLVSFSGAKGLSFPPSEFSLQLYRIFFNSPQWTGTLVQSAIVAILSATLAVSIGTLAAYALSRAHFVGRDILKAILLAPILIPSVVTALGLYLYFSWLHLSGTTAGLVLAHSMYVTPFVIITVSAGLQQINPNLEAAATVMGAGTATILHRLVLPLLAPSILAGALFAFLMSFDEVIIAWFLVGPSTKTLPVQMFSSIQWEISPILAAVSTLLSLLSLLICLAALAFRNAGGLTVLSKSSGTD